VQAVIRVLNAQNVHPIEIYRQLIAVYGDGVMNESNVRKWCQMFNEGKTNVHNERSRRPSLITKDLEYRTDQHIRTNRRFTLDEIHEKFPQLSRSLIHEIVKKYLHYKKICARWIPQMLTEEHRCKHTSAALTFLEHYHQEGDNFLDQILVVTGDETWVSHNIPESKRQSLEWHHSHSPSKPIKFKQTLSTWKSPINSFFLGPERRPSGKIHPQRPNHQHCDILCNSQVAMTCHPKPCTETRLMIQMTESSWGLCIQSIQPVFNHLLCFIADLQFIDLPSAMCKWSLLSGQPSQ
jgi:histone-lysine N-methyltransferase SETMAR